MTQRTRTELESLIDELHREAATALAMAKYIRHEKCWRVHDEHIYNERAEECLQAVKHLEVELTGRLTLVG